MEKQIRSFMWSIVLVISVFAHAAEAQRSDVVSLGQYKDHKGQPVEAVYKRASREKLMEALPSKLMKQGADFRAGIRAQCTKTGNAVVRFATNYAVESTTFNMALGLAAGPELQKDPAYARHFVENNYLDPMGHLAFMGFMLGNRATASLFSMMNATYDPCRILKRNPLAPMERFEQKEFQEYMHLVSGPIGMAAGMLLSELGRELMTDKNIRKCLVYLKGGVTSKKALEATSKGCDEAYMDWVVNGDKITELLPDMLNMGAVVIAMSAPQMANRFIGNRIGKTAEGVLKTPTMLAKRTLARGAAAAVDEAAIRFVAVNSARTWVLESIATTVSVASKIPTPVTRFGGMLKMAAGSVVSIAVFNYLSEKFTPWVKVPYATYQTGSHIQSALTSLNEEIERTRKNNWVYKPKAKPDYCDQKSLDQLASITAAAGGIPQTPSECTKKDEKPADLIAKLGKFQKKWRDSIMSETMQEASNWTDYVLHFANMYTDARRFYFDILARVWTLRYQPNEKESLKETFPLYGVEVLGDWQTGKICDLPEWNRGFFMAAVQEIDKEIADKKQPLVRLPNMKFKPQWRKNRFGIWYPVLVEYDNTGRLKNPLSVDQLVTDNALIELRDGFKAMVCENPAAENKGYKLENVPANANPVQVEAIRWARYKNTINLLYLNLNEYPHWNRMAQESEPFDEGYVDSSNKGYEELSETNVYMRVNSILASKTYGSPEVAAPGVGYIKSRRYDGADIVQSMKDDHPKTYGQFDTAFMPEYLLASMVCGPLSQNSISQTKHWSIDFTPPRVIPESVCNWDPTKQKNIRITKRVTIGRPDNHIVGAELPHIDLHRSEWTINGKTYVGMLEVLKQFAHPSVVGGPKASGVVQWWSDHMGKQAEPMFQKFRQEFVSGVLNKKFFPAIEDKSRATKVGQFSGIALPKGMNVALEENMNQHLAMLDKMIRNHKFTDEEAKTYGELYQAVRTHFAIGMQSLLTPRTNLRPSIIAYGNAAPVSWEPPKEWDPKEKSLIDSLPKKDVLDGAQKKLSVLSEFPMNVFKANQVDLRHALANLQEFAKAQIQPAAKATVNPLIDAIFTNLGVMVTDIDAYHGFVVSVSLEVGD